MNTLPGFTGVISANNMLTNGQLLINQREHIANNGSEWKALASGDYLLDCWYTTSGTTVDTIEYSFHKNGWMGIRGTGKKGQRINIANRDTQGFGHGLAVKPQYGSPFSAWCNELYCDLGSVPFKAQFIPAYNAGGVTWLQSEHTYYKAGEGKPTKPTILTTDSSGFTYGAQLDVYLEEDGDYFFYMYTCVSTTGAYKNPPLYGLVHPTDDLARCQKYYQKGRIVGGGRNWDSVNTGLSAYVRYHTPMASIPSTSITLLSVHEQGSLTDVKSNYITYANNYSTEGFNFSPYRAGDHDLGRAEADWVSEIV